LKWPKLFEKHMEQVCNDREPVHGYFWILYVLVTIK